jgi:ribosome-associated protein
MTPSKTKTSKPAAARGGKTAAAAKSARTKAPAKGPKPDKPRSRATAVLADKPSKSEKAERASKNAAGLDGSLRALAFALEKKALEPVLLDVRELCSFCNYQLVLSGKTDRQVDAIADGIAMGLKAEGVRPLSSEATRGGQWALLDYGDFVVHVFVHSVREHYDLEGLWNDAARVAIDVPAEARIPISEQYA